MSGLLALLTQTSGSLQATTAWTATISNNLSNSETLGYSRQRAELAAVLPGDRYGNAWIGRGATLQTVTQARDRFIEAQIPLSIGRHASSSTQSDLLKSVTALDVDSGVGPSVSNLFSALRTLAQNPGSQNYREAAVGAARNLATSFNSVGKQLGDARTAIDQRLSGTLPEVNQLAAQVADLNIRIREARASGGPPNDLLDTRTKLGDRLAELTGATPVANSADDLNLVLPGGSALVNGNFGATLSVQPDATNRGHFSLLITQPDGSGPQALANAPGGQLGGMLAARDGALKTSETDLDQLAFDLAGTMNTIHQAGYALDGTTGHAMFSMSATVPGAALSLAVDPALSANVSLLAASSSAATVPGDATNLQALINSENTTLTSGLSAGATIARMTAQYGTATASAQASSEADGAVLDHATAMRQSVSGVNVDEELINMQKAQRSYEAISKVIKATDDMLTTLMSIKP